MEDFVLNLLGNYAFPIIMCFIMAWYVRDSDTRHSKEVDALAQSIENNTLVMNKLLEKMREGE